MSTALLTMTGCGAVSSVEAKLHPTPRLPAPSASPTDEDTSLSGDDYGDEDGGSDYTEEPTEEPFDPDGRDDVTVNDCRYDNGTKELKADVSVTNTASESTYSYRIAINWMHAKPADGKAYGLHQSTVVVGPGDTKDYTASYHFTNTSTKELWYTCQVSRAEKSEE
ncbi:hypothetical protein ACFV3R_05785 [Streptomyces sp. NPDC059740]|uniref:hypothetical protein n=1 Tax=Streptomyces sp. NPDC059740 TaxID=3346926 RepID=UPI00365BE119